jgi:hypothetical protein
MLPTGGTDEFGAEGELWREILRSQGSIVIGATGQLGAAGFSTYTRNYDLALTELDNFAGGVRGTEGFRRVAAVVCDDSVTDQEALLAGVSHLVEDVRVPAVVSALNAGDLQVAFSETQQSAVNPDVLFVGPRSSDETLETFPDNNLVWNILPAADEVAKAYGPLLTRTIAYLYSSMRVPAGETIKVAVLHSNEQRLLQDINAALPRLLYFNDKDFNTNLTDGNLLVREITLDAGAQLTNQIDDVMAFAPHVIIELGASELYTTIIPRVEGRWLVDAPDGQARPFYLLDPYHLADSNLANTITSYALPDAISERMAGVNYASAPSEYAYLYSTYCSRYAGMFSDEDNPVCWENFYDAAWYALGAIAATTGRTDQFTGIELASGMLRLQSGPEYVIAPDTLDEMLDDLADGQSIELVGVMGPPTFDANGAREGAGSVWCPTPAAQVLTDVLRVDPGPDHESPADDTLVGDGFMPCNDAF